MVWGIWFLGFHLLVEGCDFHNIFIHLQGWNFEKEKWHQRTLSTLDEII